MQLAMRVNDRNTVRGAVETKGMLGANIAVFVPADSDKRRGKARVIAFEPDGMSEWDAGEVSVGDKIEIRILPDGEADPPTTTKQSSDIPRFLFSDPGHAREALAAAHVCNEHIQGILRAARDGEPHDEALKVQMAVAAIVRNLSAFLIMPTLKRHPDLMPEARELGLLD